jgi:hypothetical protein
MKELFTFTEKWGSMKQENYREELGMRMDL